MEKRVSERPVAGFNLVAVIGHEGLCLHWDGALRAVRLGPGPHVLSSNRDVDDPDLPEKRVFDRAMAGAGPLPAVADLQSFLASHEDHRPVCKHGDALGTVSSTIYVGRETSPLLLHAEGPPCRTAFRDLSELLR